MTDAPQGNADEHLIDLLDEGVADPTDDEVEGVLPFHYSITSYGADYPVDGLVKRLGTDAIYIPEFQRGFVWKLPQASRFVESLLLGLPVPGIFLAKDDDTQKLLVIDGQQRLLTVKYFYDGVFADSGREFALRGVLPPFNGCTYKTLDDSARLRLDDSILHATIVQQDQPSDDRSSVYHIFERLNTGGTPLSPQEMRACVYHGDFNQLLRALNNDERWRAIFGKVNPRMKDQELILRFLALERSTFDYVEPMKAFLNDFMGTHRKIEANDADSAARLFHDSIAIAHECLGDRAFKRERVLNAAVFDAVMVGIAKRLRKGPLKLNCDEFQKRYGALLNNKAFDAATRTATSGNEHVHNRLKLAIDAFADMP